MKIWKRFWYIDEKYFFIKKETRVMHFTSYKKDLRIDLSFVQETSIGFVFCG
jgi:hypothetical protein